MEIIEKYLLEIILSLGAIVFLLIFFSLFIFFKYLKISGLSREFFSGKNGKDFAEIIQNQKKQVSKMEKDIRDLFDGYEKIYKMAFKGIHKVGIVRYNPFKDIGGNQSFVIALLDGEKSGIIITSLHTREGTRIYSKAVIRGEASTPLTEEEKQAIRTAKVSNKGAQV